MDGSGTDHTGTDHTGIDHTGADAGFEAFAKHARGAGLRFEQRRRHFLGQLKFRSVIAGLLLLSFPVWYGIMQELDNPESVFSSLMWVVIHVLAGVVIVALIVAYAVMPIFRYRHYTAQIGSSLPGVSGVMQQQVSLKGEIFGQLLRYFGDFNLYEDRQLSLKAFHHAPGLPAFDEFASEDYIRGAMRGVSVEISEAKLLAGPPRQRVPVFSGLMIVIDFNDPNLVLRGTFAGKTVVVADHFSNYELGRALHKHFQPVALAQNGIAQRFQAASTDPAEAARLLSPELLASLLRLSDAVRNARNQERPIDDRLAYALSGIAQGLADMIAVIAKGMMNWFKTGRFTNVATRRGLRMPEAGATPQVKAFAESMHCSFYDDKVLIMIPYRHNLFEPDSIFRPPLSEDDIHLTYDLMTMVEAIAQAAVDALPKTAE